MLIVKIIANLIYSVLKLLPIKENKILFLSRQSNKLSVDYKLLLEELDGFAATDVVVILFRYKETTISFIKFLLVQLKSMYHLATSKVCVMDSYWPAVSMLNHKKELAIIQIWHASGKIKKSGYQTLDMPYGRNKRTAKAMNMHKNYDFIIAGGEKLNDFYCDSFNTDVDKLYNVGLPRLDYLINSKKNAKQKLLKLHPEYSDKKIILYAPTFRKNEKLDCSELCSCFNREDYALIVKPHSNQHIKDGIVVDTCADFTTMNLLAACDYVITDYSAIAFEAAAINTKTLFYLYDYDKYVANNGLNLDPAKEVSGCTYFNASDMVNDIFNDNYNYSDFENFAKNYLPEELGCSTDKIVELVLSCLKRGKYETIISKSNTKNKIAVSVD